MYQYIDTDYRNDVSLQITPEDNRFYSSKYGNTIDLENFFWFNRSLFINNIHSEHSEVLEQLKSIMLQDLEMINAGQKKIPADTFENILCNLIMALGKQKVIAIHRNPNRYFSQKTYGIKHYSYRKMMNVLDHMVAEEYIEQVTGFFDPETMKGRTSRIWPTPKFKDALGQAKSYIQHPIDSESHQYLIVGDATRIVPDTYPIILKDNERNPVSYRITPALHSLKMQLIEYNELMAYTSISYVEGSYESDNSRHALIRYDFLEHAEYPLYRSLSDNYNAVDADEVSATADTCQLPYGIDIANAEDINYFGRYPYIITNNNLTNHNSYRKLDGYLRRVYNNQSFSYGGRFYGAGYQTIRKEYRKTILINSNKTIEVDYSYLHFQMMYNLIGMELSWDPYLFAGDISEARDFFKIVANIMINAKSEASARKAIRYYLNTHWKARALITYYKSSVDDIINKFISAHAKISRFFNSGMGLKLQNYDSRIANNILHHFTRQGIACLCVHDSFLVEQIYKDELNEMMRYYYNKQFTGFNCETKEKK